MDKTKKTFSDYKKAKHDAFEHKSQFLRKSTVYAQPFLRGQSILLYFFCHHFSHRNSPKTSSRAHHMLLSENQRAEDFLYRSIHE